MYVWLNDAANTEIYTLSLHDALPISGRIEYTTADGQRVVEVWVRVER